MLYSAGILWGLVRRRHHLVSSTRMMDLTPGDGALHGLSNPSASWEADSPPANPSRQRTSVRDDDARGPRGPLAVSSRATAGAEQCGTTRPISTRPRHGARLMTGLTSTTGRLRTGDLLERQRHAVLDTGSVRSRADATVDVSRECPPVCRAARRPGRRVDCHHGMQNTATCLAARHGHPIGGTMMATTTPRPDQTWTPFLTTSAHPEYPSGHSEPGRGGGHSVLQAHSSAMTSRSTRLPKSMPGAVQVVRRV